MSQSNKGVIAVLVGGCVLGLGLGLGYAYYWTPIQKAKEARQEIRQWGERWEATKTCLLGKDTASTDTFETIVARELTRPSIKAELAFCVSRLKQLPRTDGAATEEPSIEDAWYALRRPLGKLAEAHAWRTAKEPDKDLEKLWLNLAKAIDLVDGRYLALLKAADLEDPKKSSVRLATATAGPTLKTPGDESAEITEVALHPDLISYVVTNDKATYLAKVDATDASTFTALSPLALRAAEGEWGLWIEHDGIPIHEAQAIPGDKLMAGPLDKYGEPAADGSLIHTIAVGEQIWLKFAVGEQSRVALYRRAIRTPEATTWDHQLLSSMDSGATWSPLPLPTGELYVSLKRSEHGNHISWQESPESMTWNWQTLTREGSELQTLEFGGPRSHLTNWPPELCQSATRAWWLVDGSVYTVGPDKLLVPVEGKLAQDTANYAQSMRCSDEGFAITSRSYALEYKNLLAVQTCNVDTCNSEPLQVPAPMGASFYPLYHEGRYAVVVAMSGYAALWTDDGKSVDVMALGSKAEVTGAVSRQSGVQVVLWPEEAAAPQLLKLR